MLSYPVHAAGKPDQLRTAHFPGIRVPILFVSGTRDSLAGRDALTTAAEAVRGKVAFHWVDTADHGYRPLKASGRTIADVLAEVADTTVTWVAGLPG
jgi:predicted alpha/beta-hydrolase family hydrolase